jgi:hypothetical protein
LKEKVGDFATASSSLTEEADGAMKDGQMKTQTTASESQGHGTAGLLLIIITKYSGITVMTKLFSLVAAHDIGMRLRLYNQLGTRTLKLGFDSPPRRSGRISNIT